MSHPPLEAPSEASEIEYSEVLFGLSLSESNALPRSFGVRAVLAGGIIVNLSNIYYGLRTGYGSQNAITASLLEFVGFKLFSKYIRKPLTAAKNVLVNTVSTATGCMPITVGFTGFVVALKHVIGVKDKEPLRFTIFQLLAWSISVYFFELIFASLLREWLVTDNQS